MSHVPTHRLFGGISSSLLALCFAGQPVAAQTAEDLQSSARQAERDRRMEESENRRTQRELELFTARVTEVAGLLADLDQRATALAKRLDDLLTSDDGKRLAQDKAAFDTFIEAYDHPVVAPDELRAKRKAVEKLLNGLQLELKRPNVGFLPDPAQRLEIEVTAHWAAEPLKKLSVRESWLTTVLQKTPPLANSTNARTLQAVRSELKAGEFESWSAAVGQGREKGQAEGREILVDAAHVAELERFKLDAQKLLDETRAQMTALRTEYEARIKQIEGDSARRSAEADIRYRDVLAELERQKQAAAAERHAQDVQSTLDSKGVIQTADHKLLVDRCNEPEVQHALAPFIAPGYWQPGPDKFCVDKKPVSLSKLRSYGALNPERNGLQLLLRSGVTRVDRAGERPRWPYRTQLTELSDAEIQQLKKAQQLLIELGPTMVELGMLSD